MRVLGVDLGARRIGLAVSDASGTVASPAGVLVRAGDRAEDHRALADRVRSLEVDEVVVGLPLSLSGGAGPAARAVLEEVEQLRRALSVPVHTQDERFTTLVATRSLRAGSGRAVKADRRRRGDVDAAAAAVLLQGWLDGRPR